MVDRLITYYKRFLGGLCELDMADNNTWDTAFYGKMAVSILFITLGNVSFYAILSEYPAVYQIFISSTLLVAGILLGFEAVISKVMVIVNQREKFINSVMDRIQIDIASQSSDLTSLTNTLNIFYYQDGKARYLQKDIKIDDKKLDISELIEDDNDIKFEADIIYTCGHDNSVTMGRIESRDGFDTIPHHHSHHERIFIEKGQLDVTISGEQKTIKESEDITIPESVIHHSTYHPNTVAIIIWYRV